MIGIIARKEMKEMMRDGRFQSAAAIVTVLLGAALLLGWQHYRDVNAQHQTAQRAERNRFLNQGTKNPHAGAHYGVYAFKPKTPLSLIDEGVERRLVSELSISTLLPTRAHSSWISPPLPPTTKGGVTVDYRIRLPRNTTWLSTTAAVTCL